MMRSIESEQSVLGGLMLENAAWDQIGNLVSASDFSSTKHQVIFETLCAMSVQGLPCDVVTVMEAMKKAGTLEQAGGLAYLGQLAKDTPSTANIKAYAKIVREYANRRRLVKLCEEAVTASRNEDSKHVAAQLATGIEQISLSNMGEAKSFGEVIRAAFGSIEEALERRSKGGLAGVPWGIPALDHKTGGLCAPRLIGIAARPSIGKTAMANQVALYAASHGHPGLMMSLEMDDAELGTRAISHKCRKHFSKLAFGDQSEIDGIGLITGDKGLADLKLWVDDNTFTLDGIVSRISEYRRKHKIQFAIIDYLGLIEVEGSFGTNDERIGHATRTLKKLCKRLDMPIVILIQLNRGMEKENRKPRLSDLRDSGNIEQDLDVALFLHAAPDQDTSATMVQLGLLKNRNGRKGWLLEKFEFDGQYQTFRELSDYDLAMGRVAA